MLRPTTREQLALAHAIGPHKLKRYGSGLLETVKQWTDRRASPGDTQAD